RSVFAFTGEGILVSLKLADGTRNWTANPLKELGGKPADYGMACSPLIAGDLVVVTAGTKAGTVVAYRKADGKLAWKTGGDSTGYSSPALLKVGGKPHIVVFAGSAALGLDPKTGAQLWRYPYVTDYDCNIATPLSLGGNVFLSSGENHGSVLLSLKPNGKMFTPKPVWTANGPGSVLRNEWQTSILLDGQLYGLDNVGSAGPVTHLTCVNAKTGKRVWQKRRFGKSNMIYADRKLWFTTMKGELLIVKATPKGFEELARSKPLLGRTRQAPAISSGRLFVRDDRVVVCVSVRK
ncbi:MAG: PQQ-binding-like beta-propeller repeat protein, partial [Planctomycetaceae bacterium]